ALLASAAARTPSSASSRASVTAWAPSSAERLLAATGYLAAGSARQERRWRCRSCRSRCGGVLVNQPAKQIPPENRPRRRAARRGRLTGRGGERERPMRPLSVVCAGINRHGEGEEGALHRRS